MATSEAMMSVQEPESWVSAAFLDMNKENDNGVTEFKKPSFIFPTEFPYEFDSFGCSSASLSSPDESVVGSTETESSDEDDFLAGLTQRLTQQLAVKSEKRVMAGSPESTLSGIGSWSVSSAGSPNGALSPPMTPFGVKNDTWDLIYAAASQVARLKINNETNKCCTYQPKGFFGSVVTQNQESQLLNHNKTGFHHTQNYAHSTSQINQYRGHLTQENTVKRPCSPVWGRQPPVKVGYQAQPQHNHQFHYQNHHERRQMQSRERTVIGCENGVRCVGLPRSGWPPPQPQTQPNQHYLPGSSTGTGFLGGPSVPKRECAGTGVFLPRRYGSNSTVANSSSNNNNNNNYSSDSKRKTACATVLVPAKVVQALNLNYEQMNSYVQPRLHSDYEVLMARRNAILALQKRKMQMNHEVQLPQEWTY